MSDTKKKLQLPKFGQALDIASDLREYWESDEFKALLDEVEAVIEDPEATEEEKVEAIKKIAPVGIYLVDFLKALLGYKGDAIVDKVWAIIVAGTKPAV